MHQGTPAYVPIEARIPLEMHGLSISSIVAGSAQSTRAELPQGDYFAAEIMYSTALTMDSSGRSTRPPFAGISPALP
jgi:hypothetical protein